MMAEPATARSRAQRREDTSRLLASAVDLWVATASPDGVPYLVPLSHHWDGRTLLLATSADSRTVRNLRHGGPVRLAVGPTRDLCLIDGSVEIRPMPAVVAARADAFVAHAGFDPRPLLTPYVWLVVTPRRVQAWREENEIAGRDLMVDGRWLDDEERDDDAG